MIKRWITDKQRRTEYSKNSLKEYGKLHEAKYEKVVGGRAIMLPTLLYGSEIP